MDSESVQAVFTSPPYWGLRDYGTARWEEGREDCDHRTRSPETVAKMIASSGLSKPDGATGGSSQQHRGWLGGVCGRCGARRIDSQLGLERTPEEYVEKMVAVFREIRRVLRNDGTLWLNLGDCYADGNRNRCGGGKGASSAKQTTNRGGYFDSPTDGFTPEGLKPKDLVGIPWRVAFALQAEGWRLRSDIVWAKPNPMPESVRDRPTRSHEYVFLLSKSDRYFYDADAIRTPRRRGPANNSPTMPDGWARGNEPHDNLAFSRWERRDKQRGHGRRHAGFNDRWDSMPKHEQQALGANARSVWLIPTEPFPDAHFATFPTELARRCILAGSRPGDTVLDPFAGSGTTILVADSLGRNAIGLELNPTYAEMARRRVSAPRSEPEAQRRGREDAGQENMFT
jgi:DNA modification methylase